MMLAVCLNACVTLEQPYLSCFDYYPRFRDFVQMLEAIGGPGAVSRPTRPHVLRPGAFRKVVVALAMLFHSGPQSVVGGSKILEHLSLVMGPIHIKIIYGLHVGFPVTFLLYEESRAICSLV